MKFFLDCIPKKIYNDIILVTDGDFMTKKLICLIVGIIFVLSMIPATVSFAEKNIYEIYVSPTGDDEADGTKSEPLQTMNAAKLKIRDIDKESYDGIKVYFAEGDYYLNSSVSFSSLDAGTESCPVEYLAKDGDKVRFIGGKKIDLSSVSSASDSEIASILVDEAAKSKLMKIDLSSYDVTFKTKVPYGQGVNETWQPTEIYINGAPLTEARWPNNEANSGFLFINQVTKSTATDFEFIYLDDSNRAKKWSEKSKSDLWVYGPMGNGYAQYCVPASVNADKNILTSNPYGKSVKTSYPPAANQKFFFCCIPEEIDVPGEYWLDSETNMLYFYPPCKMDDAEIFVSTLKNYMISLGSKANYLTFKNLDFCYTIQTPIYDTGTCSHITIDSCDIMHTSGAAVYLDSTTYTTVKNCHIYDCGKFGIMLGGGSKKNLTDSHNLIENNRIHRTDRVHGSREAGIFMQGCGGVARHNKVYNYRREAIFYGTLGQDTNDMIFEYNEVSDAMNEGSDFGALYMGRSYTRAGMRITNNYFHDIGNTYGGIGQQAIFIDDGDAGPFIYGNVFENIRGKNGAIKYNGAQFSRVENNVFINSHEAFIPGTWATSTGKRQNKEDRWWLVAFNKHTGTSYDQWNDLKNSGFESDEWKEHYKEFKWTDSESGKNYSTTQWSFINKYFSEDLYNLVKDYDKTADEKTLIEIACQYAPITGTNTHDGNVFVNIKYQNRDNNAANSKSTNSVTASYDIFNDYENGDLSLSEEGLKSVNSKMSSYDFDNIRFSSMGLLTNIGGGAPEIQDLSLDIPYVGRNAKVNYTYVDEEKNKESNTLFNWYISDDASGEGTLISGRHDSFLPISEDMHGKYIRAEVTARDDSGMESKTEKTGYRKVLNPVIGDANMDENLNNRDAVRILQSLSDWDVEIAADDIVDVTGEGTVSNRDAVRILQYLSHWDVVLGKKEN